MAENQTRFSEIQELNDARNVARELDSKILARIKEKQKAGTLPEILRFYISIFSFRAGGSIPRYSL